MKSFFSFVPWLLICASSSHGRYLPNCVDESTFLIQNEVCDAQALPMSRAATLVSAMNVTEKLENLIEVSKGSSRLGLPAYNWWNEGLHGVSFSIFTENPVGEYSSATSFVTPLLPAAAFDDEMVYQVADAIGTEARAFGNGKPLWSRLLNPERQSVSRSTLGPRLRVEDSRDMQTLRRI